MKMQVEVDAKFQKKSVEMLNIIRKELEVAKRDAEAARRHWEVLNAISK